MNEMRVGPGGVSGDKLPEIIADTWAIDVGQNLWSHSASGPSDDHLYAKGDMR